jgi:hypothetical protein
MKIEFSLQIFEKSSDIKFHEHPSSGSRVVSCGRKDRRTDMTKLIVAFRNFANVPNSKKKKNINSWVNHGILDDTGPFSRHRKIRTLMGYDELENTR